MPDDSTSFSEDLLKLGAVYGIFFLVQAYGYDLGLNDQATPEPTDLAVARGVEHLSHFFTPWKDIGWPLTPFMCGILLLYAPYLPAQLRAKPESFAAKANLIFFSLLGSVSFFAGGALVAMGWSLEVLQPLSIHFRTNFLVAMAYFACFALIASCTLWLTHRRKNGFTLGEVARSKPWPEILSAIIVAWLLLLAFSGSNFDGHWDIPKNPNQPNYYPFSTSVKQEKQPAGMQGGKDRKE